MRNTARLSKSALLIAVIAVGCTSSNDQLARENQTSISRNYKMINGNKSEISKFGGRYQELNSTDSTFNSRLRQLEINMNKASSSSKSSGSSWPTSNRSGDLTWSDAAFPTGDPSTSAVGIEKGMPKEVQLGAPFEYVVRVTNLSRNYLNEVQVHDVLSDNFDFQSSEPAGQLDGRRLAMNIGSIAPGRSKLVKVRGSASQGEAIESCAEVRYQSGVCATARLVEPSLTLTKLQRLDESGSSWTADQIVSLSCDTVRYAYKVTNSGTGVARDVKLFDDLGQGIQTTDGRERLEVEVGDLGPGESKTIEQAVRMASPNLYKTDARAVAVGGLKASTTEVVTRVVQPELLFDLECREEIYLGKPAKFRMTVSNKGEGPARNSTVQFFKPASVAVIKAEGATDKGNLLSFELGEIPAGQSREFSVVLLGKERGTITVAAEAKADCARMSRQVCSTEIIGIPAILLEVVDVEDPIEVGGEETYIITATNQGTAEGTNIKMLVTFEGNWTFVSAGGATEATARGKTIEFAPFPSLAPKEKAVFKVTLKARSEGDTRFKVTMTSDQLTRPVEETEATNLYE